MFSNGVKALSAAMLITMISTIPALADPHHGYYDNNHRWHDGDYHGNGKGWGHKKYKKYWKKQTWNDDRALYRKHWGRMNSAQRAQFDAQMRAQWLAYHHNRWNGNYSWSSYNDPAFLDYVHNNNPSLLTSIRSIIGF
ncbi:MAG: hypothetical protein U0105_25125 [Candidatus Obscuribacterales bacterium]|jgi:hypothetical protein